MKSVNVVSTNFPIEFFYEILHGDLSWDGLGSSKVETTILNFIVEMTVLAVLIMFIGYLLVKFLIERQFNAAIVSETY